VPQSFKFQKGERLKKRTVIDRMFKREGHSFSVYPVRIVYLETELDTNINFQFAFSVPKRQFRKAVDRNRIRRKLFEAVRLHRAPLTALNWRESGKQCAVMLIYSGREEVAYTTLESCVEQALKKLSKRLKTT